MPMLVKPCSSSCWNLILIIVKSFEILWNSLVFAHYTRECVVFGVKNGCHNSSWNISLETFKIAKASILWAIDTQSQQKRNGGLSHCLTGNWNLVKEDSLFNRSRQVCKSFHCNRLTKLHGGIVEVTEHEVKRTRNTRLQICILNSK